MRTVPRLLLVLAPAASNAIGASAFQAPPAPTPSATDADVASKLAAELAKLRAELVRAKENWTARDANGAPIPRDKELHPARLLVPRFEELAARAPGTPVALDALSEVVLLAAQGAAEGVAGADAARDRALAKLLAQHVDDPGLARFDQALGEGAASIVGIERAAAFLQRARATSKSADVRASATLALALAWLDALDALPRDRFAEAKELLRAVMRDHPGTTWARAAEPVLYFWEHLRIQSPAPEVEAVDADGKAFKLSEYKGRVVVVEFFGAWCGASRARVPAAKHWVETYAGRPFALIAVSSDEDRSIAEKLTAEERAWLAEHGRPSAEGIAKLGEKERAFYARLAEMDRANARAIAKELGITWRQAVDGSTHGPWASRWNVTGWPTTYVIDAAGRIRYRDLPADELEPAIAGLVREAEAKAAK